MPAPGTPVTVAGIDFGTRVVHAVFLTGDGSGPPRVAHVHLAGDDSSTDELIALCARASHVGVDAPDAQTAGCPLPGVRPGRCAEVALSATGHGLDHRILGGPLSMLTPAAGAPFPPRLDWMRAGFSFWALLRARCPDVTFFETWPSGSYRRLALGAEPPLRLLPRGGSAGVAQRAALLRPHMEAPPFLAMWGLDAVDALAAALAAYRLAAGGSVAVAAHHHDGHDRSVITLIG